MDSGLESGSSNVLLFCISKVFCFRNDLEKIRPSQISCVMNGSGHGSLEMLGQTIVAHNMCRGLSYLLVESCSKSISTHKASRVEKKSMAYFQQISTSMHIALVPYH